MSKSTDALTRWKMCETEPLDETDDEPVYSGMLTDPDGNWVHWEEARAVVAQLRSDLERVTAERDDLQRQCSEWSDAVTTQIVAHAETKAALERLQQDRETELAARVRWTDERDRARAALASVRAAWATQLRDLLPRVGLRALEGVPDEVKSLLEPKAGTAGWTDLQGLDPHEQ